MTAEKNNVVPVTSLNLSFQSYVENESIPNSAFRVFLLCEFLKVAPYSLSFQDVSTHTIVSIAHALSVVKLPDQIFFKHRSCFKWNLTAINQYVTNVLTFPLSTY